MVKHTLYLNYKEIKNLKQFHNFMNISMLFINNHHFNHNHFYHMKQYLELIGEKTLFC